MANGPITIDQEDIINPEAHLTSNLLPHQMEHGNTGGFQLYGNIPLPANQTSGTGAVYGTSHSTRGLGVTNRATSVKFTAVSSTKADQLVIGPGSQSLKLASGSKHQMVLSNAGVTPTGTNSFVTTTPPEGKFLDSQSHFTISIMIKFFN